MGAAFWGKDGEAVTTVGGFVAALKGAWVELVAAVGALVTEETTGDFVVGLLPASRTEKSQILLKKSNFMLQKLR